MKKLILTGGLFASLLTACTDAPKADQAEATDAQEVAQAPQGTTYTADVNQSTLEWIGTKPTKRHHGTMKIKEGNLTAENGNVTGGKFVIDVNSVQPDDQDEAGNTKLQGHLRSADFFETDKYPDGTFEITGVTAGADTTDKNRVMKDATHMVTGNLTLKGTTKSITFPAKIVMNDAEITADANFNIDRTQWGVNYQSDKSVRDKFIDTDVNLKVHLVAKK